MDRMKMDKVADGIFRIEAETGAPLSCTCYLVEADKPALVETGPACQVPALREALEGRSLSYIVSTHVHLDHAGGLGRMLADSPDAVVVVHEGAVRHLVDPGRLLKGIRQVFGDNFEKVYGRFLPLPKDRILPVKDGDVISLGDRKLQIMHTPGHVSHHISIVDPLTRSLFAGDALGGYLGDGFWPPAAPPGYDMEVALKSAAKIKRLDPELLFPAHCASGADNRGLLELVEETTRGCAGIILQAAKSGENTEQIGQRVRGYLRIEELAWLSVDALLVPGFLGYFKKQGLL
ncbi:MAG: MBL fold metallo-hydrolase [Deltaproteobacteria bacterium]|nr:MBL fold metallo-hydrolase [Deltaproteobacteria bacterium]